MKYINYTFEQQGFFKCQSTFEFLQKKSKGLNLATTKYSTRLVYETLHTDLECKVRPLYALFL